MGNISLTITGVKHVPIYLNVIAAGSKVLTTNIEMTSERENILSDREDFVFEYENCFVISFELICFMHS